MIVTLIGKPDCHLCDDARAIVEPACARHGVAFEERSILDDPALAEEFWEKIPVLLIDGAPFDFWRIDPNRLEARLLAG